MRSSAEEGEEHCAGEGGGEPKGVGGNAAPGWRRCREGEERKAEHTHPEREKNRKKMQEPSLAKWLKMLTGKG